jgi:hypothetical protein
MMSTCGDVRFMRCAAPRVFCPVAAYDFFLVFLSLLSSFQKRVLEGSYYARRDQSI